MSKFWSNFLHQLTPYVPGEQPTTGEFIKLNTNENPYQPSPLVGKAISNEVVSNLRLYPDPDNFALREAIAQHHGVSRDNVFVGNGSDEVLAHSFQAFFKKDLPIFFPDVTYSFYPAYCNLFNIVYREIELDDRFGIRLDDYFRPNGGIILPDPNAPTGRMLEDGGVNTILSENKDSIVIVDQAYAEFGGVSLIPLIKNHENLLVTMTFSKSFALAGLRVGYAIGQSKLIEGLSLVKNSFNSYPVDRLASVGAVAAIGDTAHLKSICENVIQSRERLLAYLRSKEFKTVANAAGNFVFVSPPGGDAKGLTQRLREEGILIRHFTRPERINSWVRITVGTETDNKRLISALEDMF